MESDLVQLFSYTASHQEDVVLSQFLTELKGRFDKNLEAVIFYGSCMRSREYQDAMLDFYVVIDQYYHDSTGFIEASLNALLPPNVYYLQVEVDQIVYRSKYAVVSRKGLERYVSSHAFHSYFWARFTQPIASIYKSERIDQMWLPKLQASSATTFHEKVISICNQKISSEEFWVQGLQLTYAAELRAESKGRANHIYRENKAYYDKIYSFVCNDYLSKSDFSVVVNKLLWKVRIILGKVLSVLRLLKASATFVDGIDYLAWKVERHTGEKINISNRLRRYPWIFGWGILFKLMLNKKVR